MQTYEEVEAFFSQQFGGVPKFSQVVIFIEEGEEVSGRYCGLAEQDDNGYYYLVVIVRVFGETFLRKLNPRNVKVLCDERMLRTFSTVLLPIQEAAILNWQNFTESREHNQTPNNLAWARRLGLVKAADADKMRRWQLTDLGYALKQWLAEEKRKKEAGNG